MNLIFTEINYVPGDNNSLKHYCNHSGTAVYSLNATYKKQ
jgi:hypothetical protein